MQRPQSPATRACRRRAGLSRPYSLLVAAGLLLVCAGCATSPITNARLNHFDPAYGYRPSNLKPSLHNSDGLTVILTFSGGGTRAAALAYGVLEQLRDTKITWDGDEHSLLDEVDVISSVSGGSLTAAYYGMFGNRIFEDFRDKVLYKNIQGMLIRRVLLPPDNIKMLSPLYTRTDILAQSFDRNIFQHKTFADLQNNGRGPFIIINATDMSVGTRFEFTQDQFDQIYSDLGSYQLGHAVAASAAFPGAFPSITLRNYARGDDYAMPDWAVKALASNAVDTVAYRQAMALKRFDAADHPYIHLNDGGIADNLGLLPIILMLGRATEGYGPPPNSPAAKAKTILIITVNADVKAPRPWDMLQSPIGLVSTLLAAGTAPLSNFSEAQIEYLKLQIENQRLRLELKGHGVALANEFTPTIHFVEVRLDAAADPAERKALNAMPTSLYLPRAKVDKLRAVGATVLRDSPRFKAFLASLPAANAGS